MNDIICEGRVPADWSDSIIASLFKGKGDALDQNNYCGLKLTDHLLKIIESVIENIVNIDVAVWLLPQSRHNRYNFILSQLQEKYLAKDTYIKDTAYGIC